MLETAGQHVIAAGDLFDLPGWARAVIDQHYLAFAQRSHWRLFLEHRGEDLARDSRYDRGT